MPEEPAPNPIEAVLVLLAEDHFLVQDVAREALEDAGYEVVVADGGEQALSILEAEKARARAIVTDVDLGGGVNGWEVARRARHQQPNIPVVYLTGGSADEWSSEGVPNSVMVTKPFAPAQLVTAVSQLLNVASTPPPASQT